MKGWLSQAVFAQGEYTGLRATVGPGVQAQRTMSLATCPPQPDGGHHLSQGSGLRRTRPHAGFPRPGYLGGTLTLTGDLHGSPGNTQWPLACIPSLHSERSRTLDLADAWRWAIRPGSHVQGPDELEGKLPGGRVGRGRPGSWALRGLQDAP